jgi:hypothetical protein
MQGRWLVSLGTLRRTHRPNIMRKPKNKTLIVSLQMMGGFILLASSLCLWVYISISRTPNPVAETETPQIAPAAVTPAEPDPREAERILAATIRSANFVCHNVITIRDEGETALGRTGRVNCDGRFNYSVTVRPNGDVLVRAL